MKGDEYLKTIDRLLEEAKAKHLNKQEKEIREVFSRMTTKQLYILVYEQPTMKQLRDILGTVEGLWLLDGGIHGG